jgi:hypothetical protein
MASATATCPEGHSSLDPLWCDTCGSKMGGSPAATSSAPAASSSSAGSRAPGKSPAVPCPHCTTINDADNLFCESCGYDFTTGQVPASAAVAVPGTQPEPIGSLSWTVIIEVSPDWFALKGELADQALPHPSTRTVPLSRATSLIGRSSKSRGLSPEIAVDHDTGVSRRHAQFVVDGALLTVVDLSSTNGTFVFAGSLALDDDTSPLTPGVPCPLADGDRVYVGAWTCLTIRSLTA